MERTHSAVFERLTMASVPDISKLPDDALLSRKQLAGLTGYTEQSFKVWAKSGKGPATIYVEGRPRTTVRAYREWISGGQRASA